MLRTLLVKMRDRLTGTAKTIHHVNKLALRIEHIDEKLQSLVRQFLYLRETLRDTKILHIVFMFQSPETWSSIATVYEACLKDSRIEPRVVLLPFYQGANDNLQKNSNFLQKGRIPFIEFSNYDLEWEHPDVVFLQNPYDSTRPESFSTEKLLFQNIRIAYIPYGLEVGGGEENLRWQYDLNVQRKAWRIFARSQNHKEMFAKYCKIGSRHVVVTGHPKLDRLNQDDFIVDNNYRQMCAGKTTVLWTPHFTLKEDGWSTFNQYNEIIFSIFEKRDEIVLIFRPHPLFFPYLRDNFEDGGKREKNLKKYIYNRKNILFDENDDYRHAFFLSNGLMTDAGSFLLEYVPTKKPILYLENTTGPGLNEQGEISKYLYHVNNSNGIDFFVENLIQGNDPMRNERLAQIDHYFYKLDGLAGERIKNHLVDNYHSDNFDESILSRSDEIQDTIPKIEDYSNAHQISHNFWKKCTCSYLAADPTYYDRQEKKLREHFLPAVGDIRNALDIGCGNGRFSIVISEFAQNVQAFDLSASLIKMAKSEVDHLRIKNIKFEVRDIKNGLPTGNFDFISCMGVASALIKETIWIDLCDNINAQMDTSGFLLTKETLSIGNEDKFYQDESYTTIYRTVDSYKQTFLTRGFRLIDDHELAKDQGLVNILFLWKKDLL